MKSVKLTPRKVAQAIGVSESSMKRWCDRGLIDFKKTAGGHRRIARESVINFLRAEKRDLVQSEILGLPAGIRVGNRDIETSRTEFDQAAMRGDAEAVNRILLELFLGGHSVAEIGDKVVTPVFRRESVSWDCDKNTDFRARRACEIATQAQEIRELLPEPDESAPLALGGAPDGDSRELPLSMSELVLQEKGWRARSLGNHVPVSSLAQESRQQFPRLVWVSVASVDDEGEFVRQLAELRQSVQPETLVAVAAPPSSAHLVEQVQGTRFSDNLQELESLASSIATGYRNGSGATHQPALAEQTW